MIKKAIFIFLVVSVSILVYLVIFFVDRINRIKNIEQFEFHDQFSIYSLEKDSIILFDRKKDFFIHFWATWCKPCIEEFSRLNQVLGDQPNVQNYIISHEEKEIVEGFLENHSYQNLNFYILPDTMSLKIEILPTTILSFGDSIVLKFEGVQDNYFQDSYKTKHTE